MDRDQEGTDVNTARRRACPVSIGPRLYIYIGANTPQVSVESDQIGPSYVYHRSFMLMLLIACSLPSVPSIYI